MSPPPADPIDGLAEAVADGREVDWAAYSSTGAPQVAVVRQLRVIQEIAALSRMRQSSPAAPEPSASVSASAFRWGPLLVGEHLGGGSFGEVYRARDARLDRDVALKLLRRPDHDGADAIVREGQMLARVSHPHVMAIFGAERVGDQIGIWGELLRGRTLATIVRDDGPMSADEALVCGDAVCRALAAVHRAGLLHRDVKAQNVMREQGGRIVLMDFGLGRDRESAPAGGRELAGTPLYLAPELFDDGRATVQSDLYSLGVLLFFLVTGSFPVVGRDLDDLGEAHRAGRRTTLRDVRPDLPAAFMAIVERALARRPADRFASSGVMQAAIAAARLGAPVEALAAPAGTLGLRRAVMVALAAALAAGLAAVGADRAWRVETPRASVRLPLLPPRGYEFVSSLWNAPALSPDGTRVVFTAGKTSTRQMSLWVHTLESGEAVELPQSQNGVDPFWSADGRSVAFFTGSGIRRVTLGGIAAERVATADEPRGGTWNQDGVVLFAPDPRSGLFSVRTTGESSTPVRVAAPDVRRGEVGYMWPQFLPDGERFIYFVLSNSDAVRGIYLGALDGRPATRLVASDASGVVAGSFLFYVRDGRLAARAFDTASGRVSAAAVTLADGVVANVDYHSVVSASPTVLAFLAQQETRLVRYAADGRRVGPVPLPTATRYRSPAVSGDGARLAIQQYRDTLSRIAVFDLASTDRVGLVGGGAETTPAETPDVQFAVWGPQAQLAYAVTAPSGWLDIYVKDDLAARPRRLLASSADKLPLDWSSDGRFLLFLERAERDVYRLKLLPTDADAPGSPRLLADGVAGEGPGRFSPDGRAVAYVSLESGGPEVWLKNVARGPSIKVSDGGSMDAVWLSDTELSYMDWSGRVWVAEIDRDRLATGRSRVVVTTAARDQGASRNTYTWDPRRREFLVSEPAAPSGAHVFIMSNWEEQLARRAPSR